MGRRPERRGAHADVLAVVAPHGKEGLDPLLGQGSRGTALTRSHPIGVLATAALLGVAAGCVPAHRYRAAPALAAFCAGCACAPDGADLPPPAADPFFADVADLAALLARADAAASAVAVPRSIDLEPVLPKAVAALRRRYERVERRDVGAFYVHASGYRVAAPPSRCADLLLDVAAEKAALDADEAADRGSRIVGGDRAQRLAVAMLEMGEGPFTWDFRWEFEGVRRSRPDGSILLRYAIVDGGANERVSVFSGVVTLVPISGGGTAVREVLAVGATVSPPFFLKSKARSEVAKILTRRVERLAARLAGR